MVHADAETGVDTVAVAALPFERTIEVGVAIAAVGRERESVVAGVEIGIDAMITVDGRGECGTEIPEACLAIAVPAFLGNHIEHPVAVGRTSAHEEGGVFGNNGYFEIGLAGDKSDAGRTMKFLPVGIAVVDVHHRGDASAILRRDAALVEFGFANHIAVECREDAEHVHRIEHGVSIEQDEILVGSTSSHIESARSLAHGLDTRQGLHDLHDISFAQCQRNVAELGGSELLHTYLSIVDLLLESADCDFVEDVVLTNRFKVGEDVRLGECLLFVVLRTVVAKISLVGPDFDGLVAEDRVGSEEGRRKRILKGSKGSKGLRGKER